MDHAQQHIRAALIAGHMQVAVADKELHEGRVTTGGRVGVGVQLGNMRHVIRIPGCQTQAT